MAKTLQVPVVNDQSLFDVLQNRGPAMYLDKNFRGPGSIPPSLNYGNVNSMPDMYDWTADPVITATLKVVGLTEVTYVGAGVILANADTGAGYFMLPAEFTAMMDQCVADRNRITGVWKVFKSGHAFSLRWQSNQ
jgi:hypothetical protein